MRFYIIFISKTETDLRERTLDYKARARKSLEPTPEDVLHHVLELYRHPYFLA